MDRKCRVRLCPVCQWVALRKESVDRNTGVSLPNRRCISSLSARRVWIEIASRGPFRSRCAVALRKESVDRNHAPVYEETPVTVSLSARRVWIEICTHQQSTPCALWSLSARRAWIEIGYGMFLFLIVQGGFVHADIRFNFKNCYSKKLSHKII